MTSRQITRKQVLVVIIIFFSLKLLVFTSQTSRHERAVEGQPAATYRIHRELVFVDATARRRFYDASLFLPRVLYVVREHYSKLVEFYG